MKFDLFNVRVLLKESFTGDEALDAHFDGPVVQGYLVAFPELRSEPWAVDDEQIVILSCQCWVIRNVDWHARRKFNRLVFDESADEHAFQVNKDRAGCAKLIAGTRDIANDLAHLLWLEVVHIEPGDIHASLHELLDFVRLLVLLADRADDLGGPMAVVSAADYWRKDLLLEHLDDLIRLGRRLVLVRFCFVDQAALLVPHHLAASRKAWGRLRL